MAWYAKILLSLLALFSALCESKTVKLAAPSVVPSNVSPPVLHSFQSWAVAVHSWPDYAGNDSAPNIFSRSLLSIIANKTGSSPHFRIGGTSGDTAIFKPDQKVAIKYDTVPGTQIPVNVTLGPTYYESFNTFVNLGTQYIYMVGLALNGTRHIQNALAEAQHALNAIGSNLEGIEIGNEPDLYVQQSLRPADWTESDYVAEWHAVASPITEQILLGNNASIDASFIYQAFAVSNGDASDGFTIEKGFAAGINREHNVKSVSVHSYMTGYTPATTLQASFMNHTAIVSNVTLWLPWKDYLDTNDPQIPLYIGEANSATDTNPIPAIEALQGVFGDALWKVDMLMYAMSQGTARYYVQQGTGFAFDSWQAVYINETIAPRVLPPWYGDVFIADVIGTADTVQVANIDLESDLISAYAVYSAGALSKYVVVNLEKWNSTTSYSRPKDNIILSLPAYAKSVDVFSLTAPGANSMEDIAWAGQSWNYSSTLPSRVEETGSLQSIRLVPQNGQAQVAVNASEAVLVVINGSSN